jgi:hypothetical protein
MLLLPFGVTNTTTFRRLNLRQLQSASANFIFYASASLGTAAMLLQLCNMAWLGTFWAFFAGIVLQLVGAMFQFARMILTPPQ